MCKEIIFVTVWCTSASGSEPKAGVEFFTNHDDARKFASD